MKLFDDKWVLDRPVISIGDEPYVPKKYIDNIEKDKRYISNLNKFRKESNALKPFYLKDIPAKYRFQWASNNISTWFTPYRILHQQDSEPIKITTPSSHFVAWGIIGDIYYKFTNKDEVVDIPLSEREVLEYVYLKDVYQKYIDEKNKPRSFWSFRRPKIYKEYSFKFCSINQIPPTREFRNDWRLIDDSI